MSLDYSTDQLARYGTVTATINSGTTAIPIKLIYSKNFDFFISGLQVLVVTAATQATQYLALQYASDYAFTSPQEIARVTILSSNAAGTTFDTRSTDTYARIPAGYFVRLVHVVGSNEVSLVYDYEIFATQRHC